VLNAGAGLVLVKFQELLLYRSDALATKYLLLVTKETRTTVAAL
jgi:hypothetical protein